MDWFEKLTGFREGDYDDTQRKLKLDGRQLQSLVNGKRYGIGELELVSLQSLRGRLESTSKRPGNLKVGVVRGDVRKMHHSLDNVGALFQVASQFNLLEMIGPEVTPEDGVTRYKDDPTQGPACAIAAGAATIFRNYFTPVAGSIGQRKERQLDGLADLGASLSAALNQPVEALWRMRNGYALCSADGLEAIAQHLRTQAPEQLDGLRGKLRIGLHRDVEVTDCATAPRPVVSQAFCSALPVTSTSVPAAKWEEFARFVLESAYEATMVAAALNAQRGASNIVLLTSLGGGAFGNDERWIHAAIRRALLMMSGFDLDVRLVSYSAPSRALLQLADEFNGIDV